MSRQALLILLFSTAVAAQVAFEGDVVRRSTGQPLPNVLVGCGQRLEVRTDVNGHFSCVLQAAGLQPGFLVSFSGEGLLTRGQRLTVTPQDTHISVRVAMTGMAILSGTVLDEYGWPLRGKVELAQFYNDNGVQRPQPPKTIWTDDLGRYRFANLKPGSYYVRVNPQSEDYLPVWYPFALTAENAKPIDLLEGQNASIDIHLKPGGGVEVRGSVTPPPGVPAAQVQVTVVREEELNNTGYRPARLAPDGSFVLHHLPPGTYAFTATNSVRGSNTAAPKYIARRTIEVKSENIEGLNLDVAPTVLRDLKGTIVGDSSIKPDQVHIALQHTVPPLVAKVQPDGSFVIPGVWPSQYGVQATAPPGVVRSVKFGSREILQRIFDFDGTDAPLRVTVAGAPVAITGTVDYSDNRSVAGARVIFVPSGETYVPYPPGNTGITPIAETDQNGSIVFAYEPPGVYRVYVVEDPDAADQTMDNDDFVRSQEKAFPPVTVTAGENPHLKLVLPSR